MFSAFSVQASTPRFLLHATVRIKLLRRAENYLGTCISNVSADRKAQNTLRSHQLYPDGDGRYDR